jgi:hypothetical protein
MERAATGFQTGALKPLKQTGISIYNRSRSKTLVVGTTTLGFKRKGGIQPLFLTGLFQNTVGFETA